MKFHEHLLRGYGAVSRPRTDGRTRVQTTLTTLAILMADLRNSVKHPTHIFKTGGFTVIPNLKDR